MHLNQIGLLSSLVVFAAGCLEPGDPNPDGGTTVDVTCEQGVAPLTLTELHPQVIGVVCVECHKPDTTAPDMSTVDVTHASVVNQVSPRYGQNGLKIVDPGKLANSVLWLKVNGGSPRIKGPNGELIGGQMPNGRQPLSDDQKALIERWICTGATR